MSTAAAELASRWRGWGVWVALALSLTLNVFVLGGVGWSMLTWHPRPEGAQRFIQIGRSLDLNGEQRQALRQFGTTARDISRGLHQANAPLIHGIWTELGKAQPDSTKIQALADQVLSNRRAYQHKMSQNLMSFLAVLQPDQRERFVDSAMRPPRHPH